MTPFAPYHIGKPIKQPLRIVAAKKTLWLHEEYMPHYPFKRKQHAVSPMFDFIKTSILCIRVS